jgi:SAM-dependent methyltransferase
MQILVNMIRRAFGIHRIQESLRLIEDQLLKSNITISSNLDKLDDKPLRASVQQVRELVAQSYIRGNGIEIGAFASPLIVPSGVKVTYIDKSNVDAVAKPFAIAGLTLEDFGVNIASIIKPDIVDDGETLAKVGDYSQDFVIANHVLEHFEDPIKGFKNMLRVLRHDGILYLSLPEMRRSFDRTREQTSFEHILRDYEEGPAWSRNQAYSEFAKIFVGSGVDKGLFKKVGGAQREAFELQQAQDLDSADFSIHFHAWTMDGMQDMFMQIKKRFNLSFETRLMLQNEDEVIFIFQKTVTHV